MLTDNVRSSTRVSRVAKSSSTVKPIASTPAKVTHWLEEPVLDALMSQGTQVACVLHPALGCLYMTPNWHAQFGYTVAATMGPSFWGFVHEHHQDKLQLAIKQFATGKHANDSLRVQMKNKQGKWRWVDIRFAKVMKDEKSGEKQVLCLMQDVTSEMQVQNKLHRTSLENELALKARSEFLAHLSHELRTPLNAILGFTQMIEGKVYGPLGNDKYNGYIENIQDSGKTLLSKLNDLFDIAYIDAGYTVLDEDVVDLETLIRESVEIHSHKAFEHQVNVKIKPIKTPISVNVDRIKLFKVIINLLSNAIKFNKSGGEVIVSVEFTKDKDLAIIFSDTGTGLTHHQLKQIKDAMEHEEGFVGRDRNHIGLGLAIAAELVRMHHGVIEVESKSGEGSHFAIVLPASRVVATKKTSRKAIQAA